MNDRSSRMRKPVWNGAVFGAATELHKVSPGRLYVVSGESLYKRGVKRRPGEEEEEEGREGGGQNRRAKPSVTVYSG